MRQAREEARLIEQYWAEVARDPATTPPLELDESLARVIARLEREIRLPDPSDTFVGELREQLRYVGPRRSGHQRRTMMTHLERASLDGVELAYEIRGTGEPVVLVHAGIFADWNTPLLEEPALTGRYRVVSYHRAGCAGSSSVAGSVSVAQEAAHCLALLRHLGIERAHVVGHSNGGMIALQLALDAPQVVGTLALLESARPGVSDAPQELAFATAVFGPAVQRYRAGDAAGAVDLWMRGVAGPDYRAVLEQALPGSLDRSMADTGTFFGPQLSSVREWTFTQEEARRISQPALVVLGEKSTEITPTFGPRQELLLSWLPNSEAFVLPDATHLLHVQNPRGMAEGLATFFARHPLT